MAQNYRESFNAPIPGQSLTAELGARPWQHPPQYATVLTSGTKKKKRSCQPRAAGGGRFRVADRRPRRRTRP